jgi:purine-binding chemotaxis protein CheW
MKTEAVKLVTFRLGQDVFAADIFSVERVLRYVVPAGVPDVAAWIDGVIEHRDKVIPVVDLRRRVGLDAAVVTPETRILVLNATGGWVGTVVDAVIEVAAIPTTSMTEPPPLFRGLAAQFVRGIAKVGEQLVVVLEVDRVLSSDDRIVFERAREAAETLPRD